MGIPIDSGALEAKLLEEMRRIARCECLSS